MSQAHFYDPYNGTNPVARPATAGQTAAQADANRQADARAAVAMFRDRFPTAAVAPGHDHGNYYPATNVVIDPLPDGTGGTKLSFARPGERAITGIDAQGGDYSKARAAQASEELVRMFTPQPVQPAQSPQYAPVPAPAQQPQYAPHPAAAQGWPNTPQYAPPPPQYAPAPVQQPQYAPPPHQPAPTYASPQQPPPPPASPPQPSTPLIPVHLVRPGVVRIDAYYHDVDVANDWIVLAYDTTRTDTARHFPEPADPVPGKPAEPTVYFVGIAGSPEVYQTVPSGQRSRLGKYEFTTLFITDRSDRRDPPPPADAGELDMAAAMARMGITPGDPTQAVPAQAQARGEGAVNLFTGRPVAGRTPGRPGDIGADIMAELAALGAE